MAKSNTSGRTHSCALADEGNHVPFPKSELTRMLQPSLSGNARISVICAINPEVSAVVGSPSTPQFAQRIKKVQVKRVYLH